MRYLGDIAEDATIRGSFNTRDATGAPIALAGTPSLAVYKDAGTTQSTAGVTPSFDFDSVTGLHIYTIDTSADAFYATGSDYRIVIAAGTVDGVSVVGAEVGQFSIQNRFIRSSPLDAAGIRAAIGIASANLDTQLADLPTNAELSTALGTADDATLAALSTISSTLSTIAGYIDTEVAAIKAKTDNLPSDPAAETTLAALDLLIDAITTEVAKIPRGASAITAGGNATRTKVSANGTTLVEAIT